MLEKLIKEGANYDCVIAIGPLPMMKFVSALTKKYDIRTIVSMNPIMIDGTGMCGGCRVTVGGKTKFACVDGPDFDGHEVDYDEAIKRLATYKDQEKRDLDHYCRLNNVSL
jgi:ferredoxin--NADP+ reductase